MKHTRQIALLLAVALAGCGSVGPVGSRREGIVYVNTGTEVSSPMPTSGTSSGPSYVSDHERARANQAAGQTGRCPLGATNCSR